MSSRSSKCNFGTDSLYVSVIEPSTGLDPLSRRKLWDTINYIKRNKVVVLTTHNLEEADFLADTVMILHNGSVKAMGNPLFLKSHYGSGYQLNLIVDKDKAATMRNGVTQVSERIIVISRKFIGSD